MAYIYAADLWCNRCGEDLCRRLQLPAGAYPSDERTWDSDEYPKSCGSAGEADYVCFCAAGADCLGDSLDLREWGLREDSKLYGAESCKVGEDLTDGLTPEGERSARDFREEEDGTPYQVALRAYYAAQGYGDWAD